MNKIIYITFTLFSVLLILMTDSWFYIDYIYFFDVISIILLLLNIFLYVKYPHLRVKLSLVLLLLFNYIIFTVAYNDELTESDKLISYYYRLSHIFQFNPNLNKGTSSFIEGYSVTSYMVSILLELYLIFKIKRNKSISQKI